MEEASVLIGSLDSLDGNVPDITFAEIDISADHPTRLRFAERFGVGGSCVSVREQSGARAIQ